MHQDSTIAIFIIADDIIQSLIWFLLKRWQFSFRFISDLERKLRTLTAWLKNYCGHENWNYGVNWKAKTGEF